MSTEDKLEKLLLGVQSELKEKTARIQAAQTKLNALQLTHRETSEQVAVTMGELVKARDAKEAAEKEAKNILRNAEQDAARIRGEGDRKAAAILREAEETLTNIQATVTEALTTVKRKRFN